MTAILGRLRSTLAPGHILVAILISAVVLRLAFILFFGSTLTLQASGYDRYATNLLAGHGYTRFDDLHPDSDLPPLYSFFLVGVYSTVGRSAINVALVQIVLDVITILAIYRIGRRVSGEAVGLLAAAFTAFYPYLLFQNLTTNDTGLFIMLLALGIWAVYQTQHNEAWQWAAFAGLMFGLAALTKSLVVLVLPFVVLWWIRHLRLRKALSLSALLGLGFLVFPTPWVIRNTQLQGALTLISTNDGSNLVQGNNPCTADYLLNAYDPQWTMDHAECVTLAPAGDSELQQSMFFREQAMTYLRDHPGDWFRLFSAKLLNLWSVDIMPRGVPSNAVLGDSVALQFGGTAFQMARVVHLLYFTPLLIAAIFGLWWAWRRHLLIGPILAVPTVITVAYLIFHPSTRYRSPADPFVFILAACGLMWGWSRLSHLRHDKIQGDH